MKLEQMVVDIFYKMAILMSDRFPVVTHTTAGDRLPRIAASGKSWVIILRGQS